jgi:hypothetical protein
MGYDIFFNFLNDISIYTSMNEYQALMYTNKFNNQILKKIPTHIKYEFLKSHLTMFPYEFLKILDPMKLYKVPIIKLDLLNDYIDFIDKTYFINTNVIRGVDKYKRTFVSFLYREKNKIITLFQRYTDDKNFWIILNPIRFKKFDIIYGDYGYPHVITIDFSRIKESKNNILAKEYLIELFKLYSLEK